MSLRIISAPVSQQDSLPERNLGPRLDVPWQRGAANRLWDNFCSLYAEPPGPHQFEEGENFRGCYITGSVPRRSIFTSFVWHALAAFFLIQFGSFLWTPLHVAAMPDFNLTWSGPIEDLPLIAPRGSEKKVTTPGNPAKPLRRRGADAFHPRQTIISAPKLPTHPRQTLIQPDMPPESPKILPPLPNIVIWQPDEPARPKLQISAREFAKMHPNQPVPQKNRDVAVPEIPNQERNPADINVAALPDPARPALRINSGSSAISAPKKVRTLTSSADPPPEVASGNNQRVIAISAMPAAVPPPPQMPAGNLYSSAAISPDGKQPGVPGGSANGAAGNGGTGGDSRSPGGSGNSAGGKGSQSGVSITGGSPRNSSGASGLGGPPYTRDRLPSLRITPGMAARSAPGNAAPPAPKPADSSISGRLQPGEPPEHIFGERTFYTLHVNSPNISSKMGSWILNFAELEDDGSPAAIARRQTGKLSGPIPTHKADPPYPPDQVKARIEGEVVLYAIIRENGSVDSIQVIRSLDPVLDLNSMEAFAQWKFQPGSRNGAPVALEAVVHIPFHITRPD